MQLLRACFSRVVLGCVPQTGIVNPVLLQLPEISSISSTSSLMTAFPMASRPPKVTIVLVLLMALREDAALGPQKVSPDCGMTRGRRSTTHRES